MGEARLIAHIKKVARMLVLVASCAIAGGALAYLVAFNVALVVSPSAIVTHGRREFLFDPSLVGAYLGAALALAWVVNRLKP